MWSAYASRHGSCDAVPLLCGGLAVQGMSPYKTYTSSWSMVVPQSQWWLPGHIYTPVGGPLQAAV